MRVAGVIVAGGEAARLGGEKPFLPFRGHSLLDAVIARVRPQVDVLALNLRADAAPKAAGRYSEPILTDTVPGSVGPLAGIVTGLEWVRELGGIEWMASFPGDTPFLATDLVATLSGAVVGNVPVFAQDGEAAQYLCALWPLSALEPLRAGVESGNLRSLYRAYEELGAICCRVPSPAHAFFNVNTAEDLVEAERLAAAHEAG